MAKISAAVVPGVETGGAEVRVRWYNRLIDVIAATAVIGTAGILASLLMAQAQSMTSIIEGALQ